MAVAASLAARSSHPTDYANWYSLASTSVTLVIGPEARARKLTIKVEWPVTQNNVGDLAHGRDHIG
ncbi:hypothetical protein BFP75_16625 [Maribacter sp. 4G9]|nr:hypothetical protein BFP75_16625 [Maribacter sp. 4G9]